jgi:crotonobetainyl-CoA:carnitine CoA-transferase CaiB-like acyl-CoA transferase
MSHNGGNLDGLLVVDFTQIAAGPACAMMLADRGADVIKVEAPGGDLGRTLGPPFINGHGAIFMALNRNKRSMVLDLKDQQGLTAAQKLVKRADVVIESFRPGVMAAFGLDYSSIVQNNPHVIYCSITAYGQTGPDSKKPGVDGIVQATSGLMSVSGFENAPPSKVQVPVVDMVTGFLATTAVLDALMTKSRTGEGAYLDVSMYAAAIQLQLTGLASYLASGEVPVQSGSAAPYSAPNEAFETADGWIMIAAYQPKRWQALCNVLGSPDLAQDPRLANSDLRVQHRAYMVEQLSRLTRTWSTSVLIDNLERADIICGRVHTYADVAASSSFAPLHGQLEHPEAGLVRTVEPFTAGCSSAYRRGAVRPPPLLGQHTQEVLAMLKGPDE